MDNNQQVTIRRLPDSHSPDSNSPDSNSEDALLQSLTGPLMRVEMGNNRDGLNLKTGDLVEVNCPTTLFLGEVAARQGVSVTISVEHAVDRQALELIRQTWHGPSV